MPRTHPFVLQQNVRQRTPKPHCLLGRGANELVPCQHVHGPTREKKNEATSVPSALALHSTWSRGRRRQRASVPPGSQHGSARGTTTTALGPPRATAPPSHGRPPAAPSRTSLLTTARRTGDSQTPPTVALTEAGYNRRTPPRPAERRQRSPRPRLGAGPCPGCAPRPCPAAYRPRLGSPCHLRGATVVCLKAALLCGERRGVLAASPRHQKSQ